MKSFLRVLSLGLGLFFVGSAFAEGPVTEETDGATNEPSPKIAVIAPEQIEGEWFWFSWGGGQQHILQSAIEKSLVRGGFEVIDVASLNAGRSIEELISAQSAASRGKKLGADYVIAGKATAGRSSESTAYNVKVARASAEITLRLVRVSDGKILAVEDATAEAGGQSVRAASTKALRSAAAESSRKIVKALNDAITP